MAPRPLLCLFALAVSLARAAAPYQDPGRPLEERIKDLLFRMTPEEKARQLDMYAGGRALLDANEKYARNRAKPDARLHPERAEAAFGHLGVGSIHDLYPYAPLSNQVQAWVIASNRLGIPALFIEEGLHGYCRPGATLFPQSINLATTWNVGLARATGAAIAAEARAGGVGMILGPVLDVARDPRWGRTEEDFGEDPYLTGRLGLAYVQGMQGESLATDHTCVAEPKHFAGHGSPESGLNTSPVHAGEREVRSVMLASFEPAVREGGAFGIMAAYHDLDGVPCAADPWLLGQVLRTEWGFRGLVLSDLGAIRRLYTKHHVAATPADAVCLAIDSGVDMQFYDFDHAVFQGAIAEGLKSGRLSPASVDRAVASVLRVKFRLGLFDHPFAAEGLEARVCRSAAHLELSREVARQSMCLLRNEQGLLPLKRDLPVVAVIGPNGNASMPGDYSDGTEPSAEWGIARQLQQRMAPTSQVLFADGADPAAALAIAGRASVVVLALGENSRISGEGHDRLDLSLPGKQEALLEAIAGTGKPVVLVLQNGRALTVPWAAAHVPAILEAWYAGEFSGAAIAETLLGDNNPAGRLPVTFPQSVGQLPVFYNHFPSKGTKYADGDATPTFVFGYGLSYTAFRYGALQARPEEGGGARVSFEVTNTGARDGDEVAQVYVRETTASVATPERQLKAFTRLHLAAGESRPVTLRLPRADLAIWGARRQWSVEPGEFTVYVGGSSAATLATAIRL